jgi:hypothetical protein
MDQMQQILQALVAALFKMFGIDTVSSNEDFIAY